MHASKGWGTLCPQVNECLRAEPGHSGKRIWNPAASLAQAGGAARDVCMYIALQGTK